MSQTTGQIAVAASYAAVSTDGAAWTSLGPCMITNTPGGGEQQIGSTNTADGKAPVVTGSGKHSEHTHEVAGLYTEETAEAWKLVKAAWDDDMRIYFRYSPAGNNAGDLMFTAADDADAAFKAFIQACLPPASDVNSGDAARFTFSLTFPKYAESTVST
jgi:hypothetical protein